MRISIALTLCGLFVLAGCAKDQNAAFKGVNSDTAHDMNASRSKFESSDDPPITADTHFAAGQLNETEGKYPLAIQQYEAALKLNAKHVPSLFRLGILYSTAKQYSEAIAMWNRYIAATNQSAVGYSNLAFCQELSGDVGSAEQSYQKGIQKEPNNQACHVNYGLMLARHERLDEARQQFAAVLSPAQVHYNVASVLQQMGKKEAARAEYEEAMKADPKFVDAKTRLADLDKN